MNAVMI